jgi:hypothetical protein
MPLLPRCIVTAGSALLRRTASAASRPGGVLSSATTAAAATTTSLHHHQHSRRGFAKKGGDGRPVDMEAQAARAVKLDPKVQKMLVDGLLSTQPYTETRSEEQLEKDAVDAVRFSKHRMQEHIDQRRLEWGRIQTKWYAINQLPEPYRTQAEVEDDTDFPPFWGPPMMTPPIPGYVPGSRSTSELNKSLKAEELQRVETCGIVNDFAADAAAGSAKEDGGGKKKKKKKKAQ